MKKGVVIIGNGIAGISAARTIRKLSNTPVTIVSSESSYFFSRTALMYWFMGHLKWEQLEPYERSFWEKNQIDLIEDKVENVLTNEKVVRLSSGHMLEYDQLILATGSNVKRPDWWTGHVEGVSGLYSKQDVEYIFDLVNLKNTNNSKIRKAVIVGGGLIGVELAEMLSYAGVEVTMIVREKSYWRSQLPELESLVISNHISSKGIKIIYNSQVKEVIQENGRIRSVLLNDDVYLETDFLGVTIGVEPNTSLNFDIPPRMSKGYEVDEYLMTSLKDVYAIGDCANILRPVVGRKSHEPVWYTARKMGETVGTSIAKSNTKYEPGIWFNSAKFFDIEYQVYGEVKEGLNYLIWNKDERSVRAVFNELDKFIGLLSLGFRLRQDVATQWITDGISKEFFQKNFRRVAFEPEFQMDFKKIFWQEQNHYVV